MTRDVPDGAELLTTARRALVDQLLPAIAHEHRYAALMIANAMAIGARELRQGAHAIRREIERLRPFTTQTMPPSDPVDADVHALRRGVAAAIREGRFDDEAHASALHAALLGIAVDRLAISNPKVIRP
jgi:uncharacterized protein DUF6285